MRDWQYHRTGPVTVESELSNPFEYSGLKQLKMSSTIAMTAKIEERTIEALNSLTFTYHRPC